MEDKTAVKQRGKFVSGLFDWVEELVLAVVVVVIIFSFVFRVVTVNGNSMLPNYDPGDRLIVTDFHQEVVQGDVVVIVDALDNPIIKRVIATEGQTVDIDNESGEVYVDGKMLDNTVFGVENGITRTDYNAVIDTLEFPLTVDEGCVFVLGDNRIVSEDSRYASIGMVDERKILGKAVLRIFPYDNVGPTK